MILDPAKSYTFGSISVKSGTSKFQPSHFGGISVTNRFNEEFHPWSQGVEFILLKTDSIKNKIAFEWIMYKRNVFYFHFLIDYKFLNEQLLIKIEDLGRLDDGTYKEEYAEPFAVYLDRSEGSSSAYSIEVPYLTMFNVLLMNDVFTSIYFDWEKTNASQIIPYDYRYSNSSVYFSQYALYNKLTNGKRNRLDETIVMKISKNIDDVFPVLNNPVSKFFKESSERIVFDDWTPFNKSLDMLKLLDQNGIRNIWHILHDWQRSGYDVSLPDVLPANELYGGNTRILEISEYNRSNGNLFALHENYIDIFKSSTKYNERNLSLSSNGNYIYNWYTASHKDSSFLVKPDEVLNILSPISNSINFLFETNSSYHDVSSSYDPSKFVDYDFKVKDAGKFIQPFNVFKTIADSMRRIHNGPVSGEGLAHFLYIGYYDDVSAEIHTAQSLPGSYYGQTEVLGGFYKPLLVNFDILQMKSKAVVHGVGFYERFFFNRNYWHYMGKSRDSALMYAATEIAYGHGAFVSSHSYNFQEQSIIEYGLVYPLQRMYLNSEVSSIMYNDNGDLITASDYIRKYPETYNDFSNPSFMSQLYIKYNNGLTVYVNRHPSREWIVEIEQNRGYFNFHSLTNEKLRLYQGDYQGGKFVLPSSNGWLCFKVN